MPGGNAHAADTLTNRWLISCNSTTTASAESFCVIHRSPALVQTKEGCTLPYVGQWSGLLQSPQTRDSGSNNKPKPIRSTICHTLVASLHIHKCKWLSKTKSNKTVWSRKLSGYWRMACNACTTSKLCSLRILDFSLTNKCNASKWTDETIIQNHPCRDQVSR